MHHNNNNILIPPTQSAAPTVPPQNACSHKCAQTRHSNAAQAVPAVAPVHPPRPHNTRPNPSAPPPANEGWGAWASRQFNERTEKLNQVGDSMQSLQTNSAGWAEDVNKFVSKQKRGVGARGLLRGSLGCRRWEGEGGIGMALDGESRKVLGFEGPRSLISS